MGKRSHGSITAVGIVRERTHAHTRTDKQAHTHTQCKTERCQCPTRCDGSQRQVFKVRFVVVVVVWIEKRH